MSKLLALSPEHDIVSSSVLEWIEPEELEKEIDELDGYYQNEMIILMTFINTVPTAYFFSQTSYCNPVSLKPPIV